MILAPKPSSYTVLIVFPKEVVTKKSREWCVRIFCCDTASMPVCGWLSTCSCNVQTYRAFVMSGTHTETYCGTQAGKSQAWGQPSPHIRVFAGTATGNSVCHGMLGFLIASKGYACSLHVTLHVTCDIDPRYRSNTHV